MALFFKESAAWLFHAFVEFIIGGDWRSWRPWQPWQQHPQHNWHFPRATDVAIFITYCWHASQTRIRSRLLPLNMARNFLKKIKKYAQVRFPVNKIKQPNSGKDFKITHTGRRADL